MRFLPLAGESALFCERSQALAGLNDTAQFIWKGLAAGCTAAAVSASLARLGLAGKVADDFVAAAAMEWLRLGHLAPAEAFAAREASPAAVLSLSLGLAGVELRCFGDVRVDHVTATFGQLAGPLGASPARIDAVALAGAVFIFLDGAPTGLVDEAMVVPQIKALLTGIYCKAVGDGFLAHGALLGRGDKRLFLAGAPGAGKTTLALALAASGFDYGGDDIAHVDASGQARGAPFAAACKSGAWNLLGAFMPEIAGLPVHTRTDGQLVRYVIPPHLDTRGARPIDHVILLARTAGAPARLEPVGPREALCTLLDEGFSRRASLDGDALEALARSLVRGSAFRLTYDDLGSATALLTRLTDE